MKYFQPLLLRNLWNKQFTCDPFVRFTLRYKFASQIHSGRAEVGADQSFFPFTLAKKNFCQFFAPLILAERDSDQSFFPFTLPKRDSGQSFAPLILAERDSDQSFFPLILSDFVREIVSKDSKSYKILARFKQKKLPRAFTLIELTVTLALIILAISISLPVMLNTSHLQVATQARTLQTTCWALQQQALAQNKEIKLTFDQVNNFYTCPIQQTKLAPCVKFGVIPGVLGPPASPQKPITHPITFATQAIIFYPDGRISPGSVYLVDDKKQILYAVTVSVASISSVRLYRYANSWKLC